MSIEFRCTNCEKLLRTQAGTEGKQAKCPECGTVVTIPSSPAASESPALAETIARPFEEPPPREPDFSATAESDDGAADNPYQSPSAYAATPEPVHRGFNPTRIDFGETFSRTWQIFKANLGMCMAGTLLTLICSSVAGVILSFAFMLLMINADEATFVVLYLLQQIVSTAIGAFFFMGLILFMLRIARGQDADLGILFSAGPFFVYGAAIQIIVSLATMVGFFLLIIPGVIVWLMLSQAMFMLVDQRADIGGSLKLSIEAMKGNKLTVFGIAIVGFVLTLLITLFTCGIGLLFAAPFMMLLMTVIYLGVTGQRTVVDGAPQYGAERSFDAGGMQPT